VANPLIDIRKMLSARRVPGQVRSAREEMAWVLKKKWGEDSEGLAYSICKAWQDRFDGALRMEIPKWAGFAAFRCITDFSIPSGKTIALNGGSFPPDNIPAANESLEEVKEKIENGEPEKKIGKYTVDTYTKCCGAYRLYFERNENLNAGKLFWGWGAKPRKTFSKFWIPVQNPLRAAGNIIWLWRCIGANFSAYAPYPSMTSGSWPMFPNSRS